MIVSYIERYEPDFAEWRPKFSVAEMKGFQWYWFKSRLHGIKSKKFFPGSLSQQIKGGF